MKLELFPFQKKAVTDLRIRIAGALNAYRCMSIPQVISLQAPTGAGKTIIMAALIEEIYFGTENYAEQPEAIFVWLSDSPALNEQSRQKIDLKADRIKLSQCVTIEDESFDMEELEDGHIYFLNTQKLGKAGNLGRHGDGRTYTIWETLENTAKKKSDRLYFIIDEAHRGMQGRAAGTATSIMQRFLKGSRPHGLSPMPVVIGMSATSERFNRLVGETSSGLYKVIITPNEVRASGLLKDRIVITYPDDPAKNNDMAVLQAATDEWKKKCDHWYQYSYEQHYAQVNPVFVIQVQSGTGKAVSDTNLDDIIAKIEERSSCRFSEHEVVHTFGSSGMLTMNGLPVHHIEPSDITEDRRVRVVLFKENLSTGWDCPRAETMMSFCHREDATYIAQLLGRMVRTPLQKHIMVDDSLNDVRLYLPYFNRDTVKGVIDELQNSEGGEIPTVLDEESLEDRVYVPWTIHTKRNRIGTPVPGQMNLSDYVQNITANIEGAAVGESGVMVSAHTESETLEKSIPVHEIHPQEEPLPVISVPVKTETPEELEPVVLEQLTLPVMIDREAVVKFINEQAYLTYMVKNVKINSYLKSLLSLASLLTQNMIYQGANDEVRRDVTGMIRSYVDKLHQNGQYEGLANQVLQFKLMVEIFDVFGENISGSSQLDLFASSNADIDRQLRIADAKLGNYGFSNIYGNQYFDENEPDSYKIDVILFAADDECIAELNSYAENKFHALNDQYRMYVANKSEKCRKLYSDIIADGDAVSEHSFYLPETISVRMDKDGRHYYNHLFVDEETGYAAIKLNGWEAELIEEESKRSDFVCWLRNPPRERWALCIPYDMNRETKPAYPDFIVVRRDEQLGYVIDILEPHNPEFKDNLGKAQGLAAYAEKEYRIGRIQLIRKARDAAGKTRFKRLDFSKGEVRKRVLKAINTDELDHIFDECGFFE
ncbi:MAG: DEAD/DEAH box helicase family protein [Lachnospiraceae bacterium]|nr:DEAD/DEAH box helicase family protein [Lachnospiraceae bacterium]